MQSRRKWKRRYYNLRKKIDRIDSIVDRMSIEEIESVDNKDIEDLCNECSAKVKEVGFTKEDIDRIVAETREMGRKAEKYDLLVEKLKELRKSLNKDGFVGYADEITDILQEVEEDTE